MEGIVYLLKLCFSFIVKEFELLLSCQLYFSVASFMLSTLFFLYAYIFSSYTTCWQCWLLLISCACYTHNGNKLLYCVKNTDLSIFLIKQIFINSCIIGSHLYMALVWINISIYVIYSLAKNNFLAFSFGLHFAINSINNTHCCCHLVEKKSNTSESNIT